MSELVAKELETARSWWIAHAMRCQCSSACPVREVISRAVAGLEDLEEGKDGR